MNKLNKLMIECRKLITLKVKIKCKLSAFRYRLKPKCPNCGGIEIMKDKTTTTITCFECGDVNEYNTMRKKIESIIFWIKCFFVRILHKLNLSLHIDKIPVGEDCFELNNSEHNLKVVNCPYYKLGKHFDGGCLFLGITTGINDQNKICNIKSM